VLVGVVMGWDHSLITKLIELMEVEGTESIVNGFKYTLWLYGVGFTLEIWTTLDGSGQIRQYRLNFQYGPGSKMDGEPIEGPSLDIRNVVNQIRSYAQGETRWREWQWLLSDAFVDAGFRFNEKTGLEIEEHHFKASLSKGGINLFFEIEYKFKDNESFCSVTDTSNSRHSLAHWLFDGEMSQFKLVVDHVHSIFQSQLIKDGEASVSVSQQPNGNTPRSSVSNPPAQGSKSSDSSTIRLYDAIVELLIVVYSGRKCTNDKEVIDLLQQAREILKP
jgi:hypothetical protein